MVPGDVYAHRLPEMSAHDGEHLTNLFGDVAEPHPLPEVEMATPLETLNPGQGDGHDASASAEARPAAGTATTATVRRGIVPQGWH